MFGGETQGNSNGQAASNNLELMLDRKIDTEDVKKAMELKANKNLLDAIQN